MHFDALSLFSQKEQKCRRIFKKSASKDSKTHTRSLRHSMQQEMLEEKLPRKSGKFRNACARRSHGSVLRVDLILRGENVRNLNRSAIFRVRGSAPVEQFVIAPLALRCAKRAKVIV